MLIYGVTSYLIDEYLNFRETTTLKSLKYFFKIIVPIFSKEHLRKLNVDDIVRLITIGKKHEFLSILRSIDCIY